MKQDIVGWETFEFSEIADLNKGKYNPVKDPENYHCIELEHLDQETGRLLGFTESKNQLSIKSKFNKGEVLFGKLRPYLKKYWFATFDGVCSTEIWVLKPKTKVITGKYLFYLVQSDQFIEATYITSGSKMPRADWSYVSEVAFTLPSLPEQKQIAEVLSTWDETIEKTEKLIAIKQQFKHGLMQELLTGKTRFPEFADEPWQEVKLGTKANIRRGASPRPINNPDYFSEKGRGWIRISDVTSQGMYLNYTTQYLSDLGASKSVQVEQGDLIMSICATIGVPKIVNIPACIHDGFVLIRDFETQLDKYFLFHFIGFITDKLSNSGQPGTQKNLNTTIVNDIIIPDISLNEQQKIAEVLTTVDAEIINLKKQLDNLKAQKKALMQKLLTGQVRVNQPEAVETVGI